MYEASSIYAIEHILIKFTPHMCICPCSTLKYFPKLSFKLNILKRPLEECFPLSWSSLKLCIHPTSQKCGNYMFYPKNI